MTKQKKGKKKNKRRLFQIIALIAAAAFIYILLSNIFNDSGTNLGKKKIFDQADLYKFKKQGELTFQTSNRNYISQIDIEFADNAKKRADGLMYRNKMEENQGMLFVFPKEEIQSFWMKNTILSLDMIFINSSFNIVTIHRNTKPYATISYASTEPSQYVLETIAGYTEKHNINVGDIVTFRKTN